MRRSLVAVYVHLVWATWDRLPLLDETIERAVYRAIEAKAAELGSEVLAIGVVKDHVRLLTRLPATITIADLVQKVKGASAHLITHELRPGEFFQWQGTYAAFCVSHRQLTAAKDYIARQREHHANSNAAVQWETAVFQQLYSPADTTATISQ